MLCRRESRVARRGLAIGPALGGNVEATTGLEPVYAVLQTAPWPLGHVATDAGCPARIRTSVHGSKVRCPAS
jgi:hypothetical protein